MPLCCAVAAGGGAVPGRAPPQCGLHQLLPSVRRGAPHHALLQTSRYVTFCHGSLHLCKHDGSAMLFKITRRVLPTDSRI